MIRGPARARAFAHRKGASAGASPPATIPTAHACAMQTGAATRLARSRNPQMDPLAPHLSAAVTGASFALATASRGRAPAGERRRSTGLLVRLLVLLRLELRDHHFAGLLGDLGVLLELHREL